jgi:hypothetical protein
MVQLRSRLHIMSLSSLRLAAEGEQSRAAEGTTVDRAPSYYTMNRVDAKQIVAKWGPPW